jgi:hypothetical protein
VCIVDEIGFAYFRCQTLNHVYSSSCRRLSKVLWRGSDIFACCCQE